MYVIGDIGSTTYYPNCKKYMYHLGHPTPRVFPPCFVDITTYAETYSRGIFFCDLILILNI